MHTKNLFFFTGENSYVLSEEVRRWRETFTSKHGPENLIELESQSLTLPELLDAVSSAPFISQKRLVVVHGIPKIEREDLVNLRKEQHPDTVLLIECPKPDKRLSVVKDLEKSAERKSFDPLPMAALIRWIKDEAALLGSWISDSASRELTEFVGTDQWLLHGEVQKLALFAGSSEITPDSVRLLAVPSGVQVIWKLTDLIGSGRTEEALAFFRWQLDRGEDAYGMWAIVLNLLKNLALVWALRSEGVQSEREIASATGVHFLSIRNLLSLSRSFDLARIRSLVEWAADGDIALKSGGYRYTAERPDEVVALAESAIVKCGRVSSE